MAKQIIQFLKLEAPYPDVDRPNQTLYIDATAAQNLGMNTLVYTGALKNIKFRYRTKSDLMDATLHSLEFPHGNIIRLTGLGMKAFHLRDGARYWVEWNKVKKSLVVLREVTGK